MIQHGGPFRLQHNLAKPANIPITHWSLMTQVCVIESQENSWLELIRKVVLPSKCIWDYPAFSKYRPSCFRLQCAHITQTKFKSREIPFTHNLLRIVKSFWNFAQGAAGSLPRSVQNFKSIGQLKWMSWGNEISRDLGSRWFSTGYPILGLPPVSRVPWLLWADVNPFWPYQHRPPLHESFHGNHTTPRPHLGMTTLVASDGAGDGVWKGRNERCPLRNYPGIVASQHIDGTILETTFQTNFHVWKLL